MAHLTGAEFFCKRRFEVFLHFGKAAPIPKQNFCKSSICVSSVASSIPIVPAEKQSQTVHHDDNGRILTLFVLNEAVVVAWSSAFTRQIARFRLNRLKAELQTRTVSRCAPSSACKASGCHRTPRRYRAFRQSMKIACRPGPQWPRHRFSFLRSGCAIKSRKE